MVEHKEFRKLVQLLRPGYKLPKRHDIGGPLLGEMYEYELDNCKDFLSAKNVTLDLDGVQHPQ